MDRISEIKRKTAETDIVLKLNIDGNGESKIDTGIGFLDHMLTLFARHGFFDLDVKAVGDLDVDCHHTVEDVGIVLGEAIAKALGNKESIRRYGVAQVPMDEALTEVTLDIGGRAYLVFNAEFNADNVGGVQCQMFEEFFRAVAFNSNMTLHINNKYGKNDHHIAESCFKAFARALDVATSKDERVKGVLSTKGIM